MIVIPMAGMSRRFFEAGYTKPKFMLPLHGRSLFDWAVLSFDRYRKDRDFLLVTRNEPTHAEYARERMRALGFTSFRVIMLPSPTAGQATTVAEGLRIGQPTADDDLLVFNIDTIRPGFEMPASAGDLDGYVEVAHLPGDHWSFVMPAAEVGLAKLLTEKKRISDLCSTGVYHFRSARHFLDMYDVQAALSPEDGPWKECGEHYISPFYNAFIARGERIGYEIVPLEAVWFSGTPAEYDELCRSSAFRAASIAANMQQEKAPV